MAIPRNLANIAPHMNASSTELVVNDGGADLNFRVEGDTDANLLFVDAGAENVGIGTNTPAVKLHVAGTGNANSIMTNQVFRIVGGGNALNFGDDGTDSLIGVGNSSSNISILSRVAGVYSKTLTVNSDSTIKTAATISVGDATPSTSGAGITFPATQSASSNANTLDDYEEGTWTPTIIGTTSAGTATYATRVGRYTKIGNIVQYDAYISYSSGTGTGDLRVSGLPFTSSSGSYPPAACALENIALTANNYAVPYVQNSNTYIVMAQNPTGGGGRNAIAYDVAGEIQLQGTYSI